MAHDATHVATTHGMSSTVLLVEDHAIVRQACRNLLERAGYRVAWEGGNGSAAYQAFTILAPDIVIADLSLEDVNGLETIRRIRRHDDQARIVVFSMHDDVTFATRALSAGAAAYVTKTSAPGELIAAVRAVLGGKRYLSHDIAQTLVLSELSSANDPITALTDRELTVFQLLVDGHTSTQIGKILNISTKSASNYVSRIKTKLGATSIAELVRIAINSGVVKENLTASTTTAARVQR